MREIKFELREGSSEQTSKRIGYESYDPYFDGGAWYYVLDSDDILNCRTYWPKGMNKLFRRQYTGLHDATKWGQLKPAEQKAWLDSGKTKEEWNGKEIYEGDILGGDKGDILGGDIRTAQVKFGEYCNDREYADHAEGTGFYIENRDGVDSLTQKLINVYGLKVIGNLHENPELFKPEGK